MKSSKFPAEMISKVEEVFKRFGYPDYPNTIEFEKFGEISRYLGKNPTEEFLRKLRGIHRRRKKKLGGKKVGLDSLTPVDFLILFSKIKDDIDEEEMNEAFDIFSIEEVTEEYGNRPFYSKEEFGKSILERYYPNLE